jgi:serine/threonine protein kinase
LRANSDFPQYFQDRYTVTDRKLGSGKYGNVYLGKEVATKKQVACKIINLELAMQQLSDFQSFSTTGKRWEAGLYCAQEEKRRVMREIKILVKLSHVSCSFLRNHCISHLLAEYH